MFQIWTQIVACISLNMATAETEKSIGDDLVIEITEGQKFVDDGEMLACVCGLLQFGSFLVSI